MVRSLRTVLAAASLAPLSAALLALGVSAAASAQSGGAYPSHLVKIVVPLPSCFTLPVPEITPGTVTVSERSKIKRPLSVTSPRMLPLLPPLGARSR